MRQYKDSGIEWIGKIPETWEVSQLSNLFKEHSKRNIGIQETNLLSLSYGSIIRKNINDNGGLLPESFEGYNIVEKDDIVFRLTDLQNDKRSLRTGLVKERGIITSAYVTVRKRDYKNSSSYFHYLFHSCDECKIFYGLGAGVRQGMNFQDLKKLGIVLPPLSEQQRIASYLDKKCGEIDSLIGLQEQMIEKLKAYKQSVITEAVTKGLDPNAKLVPSGIDWIGEIPEGWKVMRMKFLGTFQNGLTYTPYDVCGAEGILVLRSSNIQDAKLTFDDNVFVTKAPEELMVKKGDIIICSRNGSASLVGKCALVEEDIQNCSFGAFMVRFRSVIFQKYAFYLVSTVIPQYKQLFTTTTINQLTKGMLSSMMGVLPSMDEQHTIAAYLDTKCSDIDRLIALKQQKIESLKDYKKSVIYEAVTGKTEI
jgi:type I restriction enzyme S subunit